LHRLMLCLLAASASDALQVRTVISLPCQLRLPAMLALAADDKEPKEPPDLQRPPSRPEELMTEAEKRRQSPVHELKHRRENPKIRNEEGELIQNKPKR